MADSTTAAAALQVVQEPVYRIPRHWLRPLQNPATGRAVNPRHHFDPVKLQELADSIRQIGLQQAVVVRVPADAAPPETWTEESHPALDVVAGERRWRAHEIAGVDLVACSVRVMSIEEAVDVAVVENAQRAELSPVEEGRGFQEWINLVPGRTQQQLAERIGRDQSFVSGRIALLGYPQPVLDLLEEGVLGPTQVRDFFRPFTKLTAEVQGGLFATAVEGIRKLVTAGGVVTNDAVHHQVTAAAIPISRPLSPEKMVYPGDSIRPLFDAAAHEDCRCGGPAIKYVRYWDGPAARCFDAGWWENAQAAAEKVQEEKRAREVREAQGTAGHSAVKLQDLQQKFGYGGVTVVTTADGAWAGHALLHPDLLPAESLILVTQEYPRQVVLACTDQKIIAAARKRADAELAALLDERRRERTAADRVAVASAPKWSDVVALLTGADAFNLKDHATAIRKEFGLKKGDDDARTLTAVLVLRRERGELASYNDPFEGVVKKELQERYAPALRDLWARATTPKEDAQQAAAPVKKSRPRTKQPSAVDVPQAPAAAEGESIDALVIRGSTEYRKRRELTVFHPAYSAFGEGIRAFHAGTEFEALAKPIDVHGELAARQEGYRWAQEQAGASHPALPFDVPVPVAGVDERGEVECPAQPSEVAAREIGQFEFA